MTITTRLLYCITLFFAVILVRLGAQPTSGPVQPVVLEHADSIVGQKSLGQEKFSGHVRFTQGVVSIETDEALYYPDTKRVVMTGNVRVIQPGTTMTAPRAEYDGNTRIATAPSGITIQDTSGTLTAGSGEYYASQKKAVFHSGVTYKSGTATVKANEGEYYSYENHSVFRGNVVYQDGPATLRAEEGEYFANGKRSVFRQNVVYSDGAGATVHADAGEFLADEERSSFRGNVVLKDTSGTIRAGAVDYSKRDRKAFFRDRVLVQNDSGTVAADQLTYWRDTRQSLAVGNVNIVNRMYATTLTGDRLQDFPEEKYSYVIGRAKLVQIDTVRDSSRTIIRYDTTTLTANKIEAFRKNNPQYVATDSVHLVRTGTEARSYIARYFTDDSLITLGPQRFPRNSNPAPSRADSAKDSSSTPAVTGTPKDSLGRRPIAWQNDAQMSGDTMTIRLRNKRISSVLVDGNAFAIMEGKRQGRFDQLTGEHVAIIVAQDTIRQVQARNNAASIAFMYDNERPNGVNRASGDQITIAFKSGQVSRITVQGNKSRNNGEYFPERFVGGSESQYRLAGFNWFDRTPVLPVKSAPIPPAASPSPNPPSPKPVKKPATPNKKSPSKKKNGAGK